MTNTNINTARTSLDVEKYVDEYDHINYPPLKGNPLQNRSDAEGW